MGDQTRAFGGHHEIPARLGRGHGRGHGSIRGLGRGRGRGRSWSWTRHSQSAEHCTSSSQNTQPSAMGQALQDGFTQEVAPEKGPPQVFKCDLCNVECKRLEILEQHKIGKKHMKNLQKIGPLINDVDPSAQMMNEQGSASSFIVMASSQQPIRPQGQTQSMPEAAGPCLRQALQDGFTQEVAPEKGPPQVFKCDLCNVECNRLEILEQHKIGKKHVKNLQKIRPLTKDADSSAQMMNKQGPASSSIVMTSLQQPIRPQGGQTQSMPEAAGETAGETVKVSKQTDISAAPKHATVGTIEVRNGKKGVKRKLKAGAGGKRLKVGQHILPVAAPVVCELCNIKCDTQEVLNIHLSGKKHISKAKRYQGHAGPVSLQAAHPPYRIL